MSGNKDFRNEFLKDGKNVIISKKMKEIRLSRDMTQGDVAKELHIDRSVYAKYETGKKEELCKQLISTTTQNLSTV